MEKKRYLRRVARLKKIKMLFYSRFRELGNELADPEKAIKYFGWKREYALGLQKTSEELYTCSDRCLMELLDCPPR